MYRWDKQVVGHGPLFIKFVCRLARDEFIARRREARNINPVSLNFDENADLLKLGIFDHVAQKTQEIFYEAKKFKTGNQYQYSWTKNSSVHHKKNAESRAIKVMDIYVLVQLSNQESQWTYKATLLLTVNISGKVWMTRKTIK